MDICIKIHPKRLVRRLAAAMGVMTLASIIGQVSTYFWGDGHLHGFVPLFNLDREMNIPTWFSAFLFLLGAVLLWVIGTELRARMDPLALRWRVMAVVFLILSVDEISALHEMTVDPLRDFFHAGGYLHFSWVILGMAVILGTAILFLRPFLSLPGRLRLLSAASAGLFISGSLGMEMIAGRWVEAGGASNFRYAMMANAEETLELGGLILFIHVLLAVAGGLRLRRT